MESKLNSTKSILFKVYDLGVKQQDCDLDHFQDELLKDVRPALQILEDEFGHGEAQYNPNALEAISLLRKLVEDEK